MPYTFHITHPPAFRSDDDKRTDPGKDTIAAPPDHSTPETPAASDPNSEDRD